MPTPNLAVGEDSSLLSSAVAEVDYGTPHRQTDIEEAGLTDPPSGDGSPDSGGQQAQNATKKHLEVTRSRLMYIFPALSMGIFLSAADQIIVASSYGKIGTDLKDLGRVSWLATSYLMSITSFQPLYGKLSDIFGRKDCLLFAYTTFGLGALLCGLAQDMNVLIAARTMSGIGAGGLTPLVSIILNDIVPLEERGLWQGYVNMIWASGSALGAPLGGILADTIGWRWAFIVQTPICAVAIIALSFMMHSPPKVGSRWARAARIDFLGAITLVSGLTTLLLFVDSLSTLDGAFWPLLWGCSSCVLLGLFAVNEQYASDPLTTLSVLFGKELLPAYWCNLLGNPAWFSVLFYMPLLYQAVAHTSVSVSSALLLPGIFGSIFGGLGGGFVMKHWSAIDYSHVAVGAYTMIASACLFISLLVGYLWSTEGGSTNAVMAGLGASLFLGGLGNGSGMIASLVAVITTAAEEDHAVATANTFLYRSLGAAVGLALLTTILQWDLGRELISRIESNPDVSADPAEILEGIRNSLDYIEELPPQVGFIARVSYGIACRAVFISCMVLGVCAVATAMRLKGIRRQPEE